LNSWVPAEQDKLVFFPTTRTQKRYPIFVKRRDFATWRRRDPSDFIYRTTVFFRINFFFFFCLLVGL